MQQQQQQQQFHTLIMEPDSTGWRTTDSFTQAAAKLEYAAKAAKRIAHAKFSPDTNTRIVISVDNKILFDKVWNVPPTFKG